jgi:hypothetical protein
MKKIIFYILLLLVSSCNRTDKHIIEYYPDGNVQSEYDVDPSGQINGVRRDYFKTGKIHLVRTYLRGKLNGKSYEYYSNGRLKNEASFTLNKPNGWFVDYDSVGRIYKKEESILVYDNMFHESSHKFMEDDTVNISHKHDYINNSYVFQNNLLINDSSYFCTIKFTNTSAKFRLGDSIHIIINIPCRYFVHDRGEIEFWLRIEDSNSDKVNIHKNSQNRPSNIPGFFSASLKPTKKGVGYIYGIIMEVNSKKEGHDFYFKKKYIVE